MRPEFNILGVFSLALGILGISHYWYQGLTWQLWGAVLLLSIGLTWAIISGVIIAASWKEEKA